MHTNNSIGALPGMGSLPGGDALSNMFGRFSYLSPYVLASDLSSKVDDTLTNWLYPPGTFTNPTTPLAPAAPQDANEMTNPNFWNPDIMYSRTATAQLANRGNAISSPEVDPTREFSNTLTLIAIGIAAFAIIKS